MNFHFSPLDVLALIAGIFAVTAGLFMYLAACATLDARERRADFTCPKSRAVRRSRRVTHLSRRDRRSSHKLRAPDWDKWVAIALGLREERREHR